MRIHLHSGQRLPRLAGASGRAFAANQRLARAEIAAEYPTVRNQTKSSLEAFLNDVEQARQKGWALDVNGLVHGVTSIAAPVVDPAGEFRFSVSVTMFSGQLDDEVVEEIGGETGAISGYVSHPKHRQ